MNDRKIRDLFNTEEWILLNLKNAKYQVGLYLKTIDKVRQKSLNEAQSAKLAWFESVFKYYQADLIPALLESADMEERHLEILNRNPDTQFEPLRSEVEYHQDLNKKFFYRFEDIHKEFHTFVHSV